jgi:hypothetical protein
MVMYNRASQSPTISVAPGIIGERESQNRPYFPITTYSTGDYVLPIDLSYQVDLGDLGSVSLSLQAELELDYFELRSADAHEQLLRDCPYQKLDLGKKGKLREPRRANRSSCRSMIAKTGKVSVSRAWRMVLVFIVNA